MTAKVKIDNSRTCWSCGKDTMQPVDSYYKCSSCGATWVPQPNLTTFQDIASASDGQGGTKTFHPKRSRGTKLPTRTAAQQELQRRYK